ncbi:GNAT family N-acetyltransferase [Phytomonospora sp. NPDC050363]|uniref:GNAT family N-acetyltransferase n=1 Tax=Phytomonospora sp. NPDC050363 TaxID=3155642 RepID=UPI0033CF92B4
MTDHPFTLRPAADDDLEAITETFTSGFLMDNTPEFADGIRPVYEPGRWLLAEDGDRLIGTSAIFTRDLSVPGAVIPAAHVSGVSVRPTDRRRGVLSAMMRRQLTEAPEPVAALWASQSALYRRYGYRDAADAVSYSGDLRLAGVPQSTVSGRIREITPEQARENLPEVYAEAVGQRPGLSTRPNGWWDKRLQDPQSQRHGAGARRVLVHENTEGAVDGYVLWRSEMKWGEAGPAYNLIVEEFIAADTDVYLALWHFLSGLDFAATFTWRRGAAFDERLRHLVGEPRHLQPRFTDALWIRLVDLPAALTARAYMRDLDVVLDVTDPIVEANRGRWRLVVRDGEATCERTDRPAALAMGVDVLGGIYLGGRPLRLYASLGQVTEHLSGAVDAATTAFSWPVAPTGIEVF